MSAASVACVVAANRVQRAAEVAWVWVVAAAVVVKRVSFVARVWAIGEPGADLLAPQVRAEALRKKVGSVGFIAGEVTIPQLGHRRFEVRPCDNLGDVAAMFEVDEEGRFRFGTVGGRDYRSAIEFIDYGLAGIKK
jgi:hypothetical protein